MSKYSYHFFTFMLPCIVIDFFLNNQPDALIIQILLCYKTLHVSGIFSVHHQEFSTVHSALVSFMQVSDDRFQAESGCASGWLFKKKYSYHLHQGSSFCFCSPHPTFPLTTFKSQYAANKSGTLNEELYCLRISPRQPCVLAVKVIHSRRHITPQKRHRTSERHSHQFISGLSFLNNK